MLAPQWIKFNTSHVYSSVLKMQQEQIRKNQEVTKNKNLEMGVIEDTDENEGEESDFRRNDAKKFQSGNDQANLFRIE